MSLCSGVVAEGSEPGKNSLVCCRAWCIPGESRLELGSKVSLYQRLECAADSTCGVSSVRDKADSAVLEAWVKGGLEVCVVIGEEMKGGKRVAGGEPH
jgi:hypothetical protein